mgnify:FL=1
MGGFSHRLADIDNDGDLDLIISGTDSSFNKFTKAYVNNGTSFIESEQWSTNLAHVEDSSLALADLELLWTNTPEANAKL